MKIVIEQIRLTLTRTEAEVLVDALDMAADNADGYLQRGLRSAQRSIASQLADRVTTVMESLGWEEAQQVAVGCEVLAGWIEEDEQPHTLEPEQVTALKDLQTAFAQAGVLT